jgi:hypothetical protein
MKSWFFLSWKSQFFYGFEITKTTVSFIPTFSSRKPDVELIRFQNLEQNRNQTSLKKKIKYMHNIELNLTFTTL